MYRTIIAYFNVGQDRARMRYVLGAHVIEVLGQDRAGKHKWSDAHKGAPAVELVLERVVAKLFERVSVSEDTNKILSAHFAGVTEREGALEIELGDLK